MNNKGGKSSSLSFDPNIRNSDLVKSSLSQRNEMQ